MDAHGLRLFNTMGRQVESFAAHDRAHMRIHVCEPPVYCVAHIGNARRAVVVDMLVRRLQAQSDALVAARQDARAARDRARADALRADRAALGVAVADADGESRWRMRV